ncbi:hypothetical protein L484_022186 [Morus notabilis]|uniref:Cyclic nucleotide-binding domain-containing protein n=1 Tax=Morus notabilis TaxID=981085 RepID=W9R866_9ROSA|nr:hypothetical protein L484_022186 [Morus notabilis]
MANSETYDERMIQNSPNQLSRSGELGVCNSPCCTICPTYQSLRTAQPKAIKASSLLSHKFYEALFSEAKVWIKRCFTFLCPYIPGVINSHTKHVQQWIKFFVIACLVAVFVDPLFFFLLSAQQGNKCIFINQPMTKTIVAFRSMTDFIYLLHMLLQFRLACVAPESRVVGAGEVVDEPKKIALNYLRGKFFVDLFLVLPLPQLIILVILPKFPELLGANYAKNLLRTAVLVQYIPRLYRFLPLLAGQSPNGFIFETAWANFVINLLTFMLSGHVVGSFWYLFGLQRVNQCLREACHNSGIEFCMRFIDCGDGSATKNFLNDPTWDGWKNNVNSSACFTEEGFPYGIYNRAVNLTTQNSIITRYVYSLFWGFQQISTLAGNLTPSYFVWEVLFTMAIVGLGLLLFALLIGNMQNFLQSLGRRRLEMSLKCHDVERWMGNWRLPEELRKQVRRAERCNWAANRGVNEEILLECLPEELQRDIRRHLFKFVKKVRIFSVMDDPILDAIYQRLKQNTYIKGSKILYCGGLVEKMVFVVRGKLESIGEDGTVVTLREGDFFGEELLTWCLDQHSSVNKDVEAFSLQAKDLEEFTRLDARFLRNPRVQGAIRYESPYWRGLAAIRIQVAWRYKKKCLTHARTSIS